MRKQSPALDARQTFAQRIYGVNIQSAAQQPGIRALPVAKRHALRQHLNQCEARLAKIIRVEGAQSHEAMHPVLALQFAIRVRATHLNNTNFNTGFFPG